MKASKFRLGYWVAALLAVLPGFSQAAYDSPNFSISGVAPPGWPHFDNPTSITLSKLPGSYSITASSANATVSSPFKFHYSPTQSWDVTGTFNLSANFSASGVFQGGSVDVTGTIPSYNGPGVIGDVQTSSQSLFHASLTGFGADLTSDATPVALGFSIDNFSGWAGQFSSSAPESVYLYSFNIPALTQQFSNKKFGNGKSITFQGLAMTTVPVPAAFWLFGSAMAMTPLIRRKKAGSV